MADRRLRVTGPARTAADRMSTIDYILLSPRLCGQQKIEKLLICDKPIQDQFRTFGIDIQSLIDKMVLRDFKTFFREGLGNNKWNLLDIDETDPANKKLVYGSSEIENPQETKISKQSFCIPYGGLICEASRQGVGSARLTTAVLIFESDKSLEEAKTNGFKKYGKTAKGHYNEIEWIKTQQGKTKDDKEKHHQGEPPHAVAGIYIILMYLLTEISQ